ncbi:MAG: ParB/RepB/Spo0J family partition protein [Spirochaetia bacterium]|nr:ParB/RepB/Spo0J family partition protein [Spirochaetia bacterium]
MGDYTFDDVVEEVAETSTVNTVKVSMVDPNPNQPRKGFSEESMQELASSIKEQGILQPILVEKAGNRYTIVAGERRFRAAKEAGLEEIPVIIKTLSEEQKLEVALIENIQRENLNPIEESKAYKFLVEKTKISQEELSKRLGKKRSTIANSLRLLNLGEDMQEALQNKEISAGHARALLSVVNPADREYLFKKMMATGFSVRESEKMAAELNKGSRASNIKKTKKKINKPIELQQLEEQFLEALGTKVQIQGDLKKGKVEIRYYSMDDLERIYDLLAVNRRDDDL